MMHIVGVDVGGTNTDAVLLRIESNQKPRVVRTAKAVTSADVFSGLVHAVQNVMDDGIPVAAVMVGTTHFINALLQRRGLAKVCIIRLCGTATHAIPPMSNWPHDLKETINGLTVLASGGYLFDGTEISPLNEEEIRSIIRQALALDICSFCVCGVFSTCRKDQEERVGEIIREESSKAFITLSHEIAGLGLAERENAAILNACLRPLAVRTIGILQDALPANVPFFLTKNAGTLLSAEDAMRWPVFTFASGPTNSMIGAAYLTGIDNAIVIDVGGTSTDIGMIVDGKPRQTQAVRFFQSNVFFAMNVSLSIWNVRLVDDIRVNISISDTISRPLGGGTVIHVNETDGSVQVGPDSVAYRLEDEALAFGGKTITGTDIALAAGLATEIGHSPVEIPPSVVEQVLIYIKQLLTRNIDRIKTGVEPIPLILCGGGSILIDLQQSLPGVSKILRPDHFAVCNAVGAALCSISATIDVIADLVPLTVDEGTQRQVVLDQLIRQAHQQCEEKGARQGTISVVDLEPIPLAYQIEGYKHRVVITAIGELDLDKFQQNQQSRAVKNSSVEVKKEPPTNFKPPIQIDYTGKKPVFDENGVWLIDAIDIEYIAYGTGILGCGGGGESYHSKLWCLEILQQGKYPMRVVPPSHFRSSKDLIGNVAFMGAPTVSHELLSNGQECLKAVEALENHLSKKIVGVFGGEIGGANGLMGLIVAAMKQIPCVDCDTIGRAYPCLNHTLCFIRGAPVTPTSLSDIRHEVFVCPENQVSTPKELEDLFRLECTKRGLIMGICLPPITGEQLEHYTLFHSLSRAWLLGQAKFNHRTNAIEAVAHAGQGRILVADGKVINVDRHTSGGFVRGRVTIETDQGLVLIDFQNENLVARYDTGEILATVPDLITLVEEDSAEPLATEIVKYGYHVSVLVLPAPEPLTTPDVVEHIGPKAFGYDFPNFEYKPSHASIQSVWDIFYQK